MPEPSATRLDKQGEEIEVGFGFRQAKRVDLESGCPEADLDITLELISAKPPPITNAAAASANENRETLRGRLHKNRDWDRSGPDPFDTGPLRLTRRPPRGPVGHGEGVVKRGPGALTAEDARAMECNRELVGHRREMLGGDLIAASSSRSPNGGPAFARDLMVQSAMLRHRNPMAP